jgi:AcrR family transcriptional regulator
MKRQVQSCVSPRRDDPGVSSRAVAPRRRQLRSDSRKREILRAALHCFTTIGFAGATLADIRVRAKASIGSIYHHFRSKEQLAAALYFKGVRDYQESFPRRSGWSKLASALPWYRKAASKRNSDFALSRLLMYLPSALKCRFFWCIAGRVISTAQCVHSSP